MNRLLLCRANSNEKTHTLVKLSVSAKGHSWLVTSIHSVNVVSFNLFYLIHSNITSKGYLINGQETRSSSIKIHTPNKEHIIKGEDTVRSYLKESNSPP